MLRSCSVYVIVAAQNLRGISVNIFNSGLICVLLILASRCRAGPGFKLELESSCLHTVLA